MSRATLAAVILCALGTVSCARRGEESSSLAGELAERGLARPNILLITLDTTRADRLSSYGYSRPLTPHLDRIARQGILFRRCTTPSAFTLPSHASIMTGVYPTFHRIRLNGDTALSDSHETLAEVLSAQGYQTGAFIGAFVLDGRWGLHQGFDHYDDRFDLTKYEQVDLAGVQRPANEVMDAALSWMGEVAGEPFFAWIHLYDPHAPYEPPEPYHSRFEERGMAGLYDGEIAFTDAQVGRTLAWLEETGLEERTILAVMGDHGEALGSHGELTHGYFLYDYAVQVPFLLEVPLERYQGLDIETQVRTIDLYPTLLEMLSLERPASLQGRSLLPLLQDPASGEAAHAYSESMVPYLQFGWSPMYSVRTERFKYIDAPKPELYDLEADPGETENVVRRQRSVARELRRVLERIHAESSAGAPAPQEANLDQETLDRLAALGYVGGRSTPAITGGLADPNLPDPKDKLEVYGEVSLAGDLINREEYQEALRHLEKVLELDPEVTQPKLLAATCYVKTDRPEKAKRLLDEVLAQDPDNVQALISVAEILLDEGREEEVLALGKKALAVDERNTQAHILIGQVYMDRGDHQLALPYLQRAVEIQPKLSRTRKNLAACLVGVGRYDEAESLLRDILAEYPKYPSAHFHLGLLYERQGRMAEAKEAYLQEIENYEDTVPARFNLGSLLLAQGDADGYRAQMEKVIEIAPDRPKGYLFLARGLLSETGQLERAHELVEKGLSRADTAEMKALGYFLLADIYSRKGRQDRVDEALAKARSFAGE